MALLSMIVEHLKIVLLRMPVSMILYNLFGLLVRAATWQKHYIQSAFCIIPIYTSDYSLLGMCWRRKYFYDRCMPMGCARSCRTFENFSTALEWLAKTYIDIPLIIHLLDDFFLVSPAFAGCQAHLGNFLSFSEFLGIPMAPDKTIGPSCVLSFCGIELDSMIMEARLPRDKISKCMLLLQQFLRRKKVTLKELQYLIRLLNFACSVIVPG